MTNNNNSGKHTPGPWRIRQTGNTFVEVCTDSRRVADVHEAHTFEGGKNARLIAAAPELLAACKAAKAVIDRMWPVNSFVGEVQRDELEIQLRAAIAKAEGSK